MAPYLSEKTEVEASCDAVGSADISLSLRLWCIVAIAIGAVLLNACSLEKWPAPIQQGLGQVGAKGNVADRR